MKTIKHFAATALISTCLVGNVWATDTLQNPFLKFVPEDSIFFFGNLKSLEVDQYFDVLRTLDLTHGNEENLQDMIKAEDDKRTKFLKLLFIDAIQAFSTEEGFAKRYGIKVGGFNAFFAKDFIPIMKIEMDDPAAFMKALEKAENESGFISEKKTLNDLDYISYLLDDRDEMAISLLIKSDQLSTTMALVPDGLEDAQLADILGSKEVASSLAESDKLQNIMAKYQFDGYGLGYLDHKALADRFFDKNATAFVTQSEWDQYALFRTDGCVEDINSIVNIWPKTVYGTTRTKFDADGFYNETKSVIEINDKQITDALISLNGHLPNYLNNDDELFSMGYGIDTNSLANVANVFWNMASQANYTCPPFVMAQEEVKKTNPAMVGIAAAMANGFKGVNFSLRNVELKELGNKKTKVKSVDALLSIASTNPSMIMPMISMSYPQLNQVNIPFDGSKVKINAQLPEFADIEQDLFASIQGNFLTAFVGNASEKDAKSLKNDKLQNNGIYGFNLDYAFFINMIAEQAKRAGEDVPDAMKIFEKMKFRAGSLTYFSDKGIVSIGDVSAKF